MSGTIIKFLKDEGYVSPRMLDEHTWVAIRPFLFTYGIVMGDDISWETGYSDRWCYHTMHEAMRAMEDMTVDQEPSSWHRHTPSGRRREGGKEWINP